MDRRSFFALMPLGALSVVHAPAEAVERGKPQGRRVSTEKDDPGERLYAELCGNGTRVKVFLDGVEQKWAVTADEHLGIIKRHVVTSSGNMAINRARNEPYYEEVSGVVRIEIV